MDVFIESAEHPAVQVTGKGFGIRAGAYILDIIAINLINLVMSYVVGFVIGVILFMMGLDVSTGEQTNRLLDFLIGAINMLIYFTIFEALFGASPGKAILRMRVVMEDGSPCTWIAAFKRGVLRFWDGFFFAVPALMSMKEPLQQRTGDRQAHTLVLDARDSHVQEMREWIWFLVALALYLLSNAIIITTYVLTLIR